MGERMTCPACRSDLWSILNAYRNGEACPQCGLPASAAEEVIVAMKRGADAELTEKYTAMTSRALKAEQQVQRLESRLRTIREAVKDETP